MSDRTQVDCTEDRPSMWDMALWRAEQDADFRKGMMLAGPAVVEVQSPSRKRIEELKAHPDFPRLCEQVGAKIRTPQRIDPERMLLWFVPVALDPPIEEFMSRTERVAIANNMSKHASALRKCLSQLMQDNDTYCYPLQPVLSKHAVMAAAEDYLRWKDGEDGKDEALTESIVHRTRFAIYDAINGGLESLLLSIEDAASELRDMDSHVRRPSKENAKRLYFIRYMTNILHRETGTPCRNIVLELASMYFDCDDLDESAISKLAPVQH